LEEPDISVDLPNVDSFNKRGYRALFKKLPETQSEADKVVSEIRNKDEAHRLLRIVLFSSYFTQNVALTRVKAEEEKYAFDIFDALNTTGEPLTAIETFKPRVIQFEDSHSGQYIGSPSYESFEVIESYTDRFEDPGKRQGATKDLIISFSLYVAGEKRSKHLNEQRRFLRSAFDQLPSEDPVPKRRFIRGLADVAQYSLEYWEDGGIQAKSAFESEFAVCLKYLKDLKTSLTIPVLARYFKDGERRGNLEDFYSATHALTAFVFLRRAATGNTKGIDSDLRRLMSKGPPGNASKGLPLRTGLDATNELPSVDEFKVYLRRYLAQPRIGVEDKETWLKHMSSQPLGDKSKPTCRFMLLAAAHNARPDPNNPGLLTRKNVRASHELKYLDYGSWVRSDLKTVEHIAPDSNPGSGWDKRIYQQPFLKHTVGNLVLLPSEENSSVGNAAWKKKKTFYQAFAATKKDEVERRISQAKQAGLQFKKTTEKRIREGAHLPIVDTVSLVDEWTRDVIEARSRNLGSLAWDRVASWLFD
jgi:hypothetical protein